MNPLRWEWMGWCLVLLCANAGIFLGSGVADGLAFERGAVASGEWWRLLTYPLVHVSLYHFAMDAGSFLLLYPMLDGRQWWQRLGLVLAGAAGALAVAWSGAAQTGLSGLSGVGHGLMAVVAVEQLQSKDRVTRAIGGGSLLAVVGKCVIEAATGDVMFAFLHFGDVGRPVAACHLGGVIGAGTAWGLGAVHRFWRRQSTAGSET